VDDFGQPITLGDQKDIGEFNLNFLERIEEGLGERVQAKRTSNFLVEYQKLLQSKNGSLSQSTFDVDDHKYNDSHS
jgi:hypothetical protein